jgi:hypothetical protein
MDELRVLVITCSEGPNTIMAGPDMGLAVPVHEVK